MSKTDLIAVQPRWWNQALGQVEKLAQSADRRSELMQTIKADQVSPWGNPRRELHLHRWGQLRQHPAGHVANGEVIEERVWDYGDGPDALPAAIESVAQRMRELPPEERTAAQVFVLMNRDAGPPGTVPSAG